MVSYAADLTVANTTGQLRPGMTATADIVTSDKHDVLLVPNAALRFKPSAGGGAGGGGIAGSLTFRPNRNRPERIATVARGATQTVYVKGADGQPQPVQIVTGDSNGSMTEVLGGGLRPGQQVITGTLAGADGARGSSRRSGGSGGGSRRQGGGGA